MKTVITGLLIPFIGTAAGAACAFFLRKDLKRSVQRALTLHNIPEGMAVGVVYAGLLSGSGNITAGGALMPKKHLIFRRKPCHSAIAEKRYRARIMHLHRFTHIILLM